MIRLLAVQPVAERGGSDQALLRMLRSLPVPEFTCHVAVPQEPPLRSAYEAAGIGVHVVPMARISRSNDLIAWTRYLAGWPVAVGRLVRLIRALDIDIVHSNSLHSWYGWAAATFTGRAHTWHAREIVVQSRLALRLERFLARHFAVTVMCVSHAVADQLPGAPTVVVHERADPAEFSPSRAGRFRPHAGIRDDVLLVGAVGRLDTWKGIDVLLDAFPIAEAACPNLRLVVAGGPVAGKEAYFDALATRAAAQPGVRWLGPRDDVADVLADLDVVVVPSVEPEPYGLVAAEALACGVPVVATDHGGLREIAAEAEPGAVRLVPPRDPEALADAIVDVVAGAGPTSEAQRRARRPLLSPAPEPFAALFRQALDRRG